MTDTPIHSGLMLNLTLQEARQVQLRFKHTPGWGDIVQSFPTFADAVELLPCEDGLFGINPILKILLCDAVCKVRGLQYGSLDP